MKIKLIVFILLHIKYLYAIDTERDDSLSTIVMKTPTVKEEWKYDTLSEEFVPPKYILELNDFYKLTLIRTLLNTIEIEDTNDNDRGKITLYKF